MKNKKLKKIIKTLQKELLDIKAIIDALEDIEQSNYPTNCLLEIIKIKVKKVFCNFEKSRNLFKVVD